MLSSVVSATAAASPPPPAMASLARGSRTSVNTFGFRGGVRLTPGVGLFEVVTSNERRVVRGGPPASAAPPSPGTALCAPHADSVASRVAQAVVVARFMVTTGWY